MGSTAVSQSPCNLCKSKIFLAGKKLFHFLNPFTNYELFYRHSPDLGKRFREMRVVDTKDLTDVFGVFERRLFGGMVDHVQYQVSDPLRKYCFSI